MSSAAVPVIAAGGFAYAGQTCISVQRIIVHEALYDAFREKFAAHVAAKIKCGDPRDRATVIGPMISADAAGKTRAKIDSAIAAGGRVVFAGPEKGPQIVPATVLENVPEHHEACATELFAPVVTLHRVADAEAALALVNDSPFGLQCGIFTRDLTLAMKAHERLEVGAVLINQTPMFRVENMPYGGVKDSGFGREGIRYAMEEMTEPRGLIIRI